LDVLASRVPDIEVYSIDEAFLDLSDLGIKDFTSWGEDLRQEILQSIGMPVSVGLAPTKTLAKLASGYGKTHQQTCLIDPKVDLETYKRVLSETNVSSVWGVGRQLTKRFEAAGIHTALQLSQVSPEWLHKLMGVAGDKLLQELKGVPVHAFQTTKSPQKSLVASRSFGHTVKSLHELEAAVASFASQAAFRLRRYDQTAGVFGLFLRSRMPDGSTVSDSLSIKFTIATNDTSDFVSAAINMLQRMYNTEHGYKKAGVFANNLSSSNICQTDLFEVKNFNKRSGRKRFMKAVDSIKDLFLESIVPT
jgi:DNA polymerase V